MIANVGLFLPLSGAGFIFADRHGFDAISDNGINDFRAMVTALDTRTKEVVRDGSANVNFKFIFFGKS